MHNLTDKELIDRAEKQLGDSIVDVIPTRGHLEKDFPNSVITIRRAINEQGKPENIHDIYKWDGKDQKYIKHKEVYREIDTDRKATINASRRVRALQNELNKVGLFINDGDFEFAQESIDLIKHQISVIERSII